MIPASQQIGGWAIYLRVSDEKKQHPEHSLEAQLQIVQERLIDRSGLPVVKIYTDIISGQTARRPQYQQMKRDAKAGHFSHLAVYRVDRLGRNTLEGLIAFQEFIELGIEVKTASSPDIDPVTPDGKFFMGMQMLMAQHEIEIMKQRMGDSKRAILRQGGWPFNVPDGYLNKREPVANGKFRTWIEKDSLRFQMWRKAYELLLTDRYTLAEICMELHNRSYVRNTSKPWVAVTKTGQFRFHDNKLSRGLRRPFYAGRVVSEHYGIYYEDGIQGQWEPIVTVEEYERAMEILRQRDNHKVRQKRYVYLLRDLLGIEVGGQIYKMFSSSPTGRSKTYSYYMTRAKVNGSKIHIPCEVIDSQIPGWLAGIQIPKALMPRMRALYQQHIAHLSGPNRDEQIAGLKERIRQLRAEEADLGRLLLNKRIGQDAYDQLRHEWQQKLNHKQQELEALQRETSVYIDDLDAAVMLLSKMPMLFERLARRDQARLLKILVQQVVVDQSGNTIEVRLNSPFAYLNDLAQVAADRPRSQETLAVFEELESPAENLAFANRASVVELHVLAGASE
jgi:DNA invertase Pin-like site-specific DNA recombinase